MAGNTLYEQPLNERIRTFLRLEQLFLQAKHSMNHESSWHSRATMSNLTGILEILGRSDLKTDILKQLERTQSNLARLQQTPGVDTNTLSQTLSRLDAACSQIINTHGQLGHALRKYDILNTLIKRNSILGGICSFDVPNYHYWLSLPAKDRISQLLEWFDSLESVNHSISLLLNIIRDSTSTEQKIADSGFYQQSLNANIPYHLIRVIVPDNVNYFAEISAGKHRFSIRFMQLQKTQRAVQITDDIPFQLACCAL